jgi:hypothetical protein
VSHVDEAKGEKKTILFMWQKNFFQRQSKVTVQKVYDLIMNFRGKKEEEHLRDLLAALSLDVFVI